MEESNRLVRPFQNGAATEKRVILFPQIKFWCQAWLLVGKHLCPQKITQEIEKVGQTFNILSLLWILFPFGASE